VDGMLHENAQATQSAAQRAQQVTGLSRARDSYDSKRRTGMIFCSLTTISPCDNRHASLSQNMSAPSSNSSGSEWPRRFCSLETAASVVTIHLLVRLGISNGRSSSCRQFDRRRRMSSADTSVFLDYIPVARSDESQAPPEIARAGAINAERSKHGSDSITYRDENRSPASRKDFQS
jgi:hypothetical protein